MTDNKLINLNFNTNDAAEELRDLLNAATGWIVLSRRDETTGRITFHLAPRIPETIRLRELAGILKNDNWGADDAADMMATEGFSRDEIDIVWGELIRLERDDSPAA